MAVNPEEMQKLLEVLTASLTGANERFGGLEKAIDAAQKRIDEYTGGVKKTLDQDRLLNRIANEYIKTVRETTTAQRKKTISDVDAKIALNAASAELNDFKNSFPELADALDKNIESIEKNTVETEAAIKSQRNLATAGKFVGTSFGLLGTAAKDLVGIYQANASDVATAGNLLTTQVKFIGGMANNTGSALKDLGSSLADGVPGVGKFGKAVKFGGMLLEGLGVGLSLVSKGAGVLTQIIEPLTRELDAAYGSFMKINSTGALFVDGLNGMKVAAHSSGMLLQDFADVVKNNTATLAESGLGLSLAVRQMAAVGKTMQQTGLALSLRNLGIEYKEQAELVADTMSIFAASGRLRGASDQQIAQFTGEYATNLKLLSALTGEDAKKIQEKNRKASFEADVFAQIAKAGPEAIAKFQAQIELFNKADPSGKTTEAFKQQIAAITGVADPATVAFMDITGSTGAANKALSDLLDPSVSLKESTISAVGAIEDMRKGALANVDQLAVLTAASRVSNDGLIKNVADMSTNILSATAFTRAGAESQVGIIEQAKNPQDELTSSMMAAADAGLQFKIAMQDGILTPDILGEFARQTANASVEMLDMINKIKEQLNIGNKKTTNQGPTLNVGGALEGASIGASLGGAAGSIVPIIGSGVGAAVGAAIGGIVGSGLLQSREISPEELQSIQDNPMSPYMFADGGISVGPRSGYLARLHGTEAVLPEDLTNMLLDAAKINRPVEDTPNIQNIRTDRSEELLSMLNDKFDNMIDILDDISGHTERTSVRVA